MILNDTEYMILNDTEYMIFNDHAIMVSYHIGFMIFVSKDCNSYNIWMDNKYINYGVTLL